MGSYSISYLFSPPGCPSPLHSGPGGKKSPFHPSFFLTEEIFPALWGQERMKTQELPIGR